MTNPISPLRVVSETTVRLSLADYRREREAIQETFGISAREAASRFDQALAKLFYRSGWTQEQLAKAEGKSQSWVVCRLRLGRFLEFITTVIFSETPNIKTKLSTLTEGRFRYYWERTDKAETNERIRFGQVVKSMTSPPRPSLRKPLLDAFADGKWHKPATMARHLETDEPHIVETLRIIASVDAATKGTVERRQVGKTFEYRLWKQARSVSTDEIADKLTPIIEVLRQQAKKASGTVSNGAVDQQAGLLQKLIDAWRE